MAIPLWTGCRASIGWLLEFPATGKVTLTKPQRPAETRKICLRPPPGSQGPFVTRRFSARARLAAGLCSSAITARAASWAGDR